MERNMAVVNRYERMVRDNPETYPSAHVAYLWEMAECGASQSTEIAPNTIRVTVDYSDRINFPQLDGREYVDILSGGEDVDGALTEVK